MKACGDWKRKGGRGRYARPAVLALILVASAWVGSAAAQTYLNAPKFAGPNLAYSAPLADMPEAGASPFALTDQVKLRLISAGATVGEGDDVRLGLQFILQPGWKIYWRSPGAAGFPPRLDWRGSSNLKNARMEWPAPRRFSVLGLDTFGYHDEVVLPIDAHLARPGAPLDLKLKVDYLTCKEICVPYTAVLSLALPAGPAAPTGFTHLIDRFANRVPGDGKAAGIEIESAAVAGSLEKPVLEIVARARAPFEHPDLFVEGPTALEFASPRLTYAEGGRRVTMRLAVATVAREFPNWSDTPLNLTLVDGERAVETRMVPEAAPETGGWAKLAAMLGLALLGGLILNLMPCVLPVLSLKLLGMVGHGGTARAQIRTSFLASAAGVVCSVLVLAGVAIGIKAAGGAVGWGIQFQEPIFLTGLALLCVFFAANLWGLFELRLPGFLADAVAGAPGKTAQGVAGHFLTGAFAAVLATPCSAPFLGTALGFALARGPGEIGAIFLALGLGLASPYLAVAAVPDLARHLPHPGRWMVVLKGVLGVALAATALWLVSVMADLLGLKAALAVGGALAGIPLVFWARRIWPDYTRRSGIAGVAALVILAFALPGKLPPERADTTGGDLAGWQPFERAEIPSLVAQGKVVFVDVTADWCLTCKANRALVLDQAPVAGLLAAPGVVRMLADWTRPSDGIAAYLASFGRYGIPFNVVYGPGAPQGAALPELLSADAVRAALQTAATVKHATAAQAGR